jgi:type IV secretion system protein VirB4
LVDASLIGGLEPKLGDRHLGAITVLGFPNATRPGLLDDLNHLRLPYRWTTRFVPLDHTEANRTLTRLRRQWFAKRKSVYAVLREVMFNEPTPLLDSDADNKASDADLALQELGTDQIAFGYVTTTIVMQASSDAELDERLRAVERAVNGRGFTTIRETINAVEAWFGSLPGHVYANVRQPLVHTLNLCHLVPLSAVWAGQARDDHLDGPPLFLADTSGATPFRFSLHIGDVGHLLIVGPTGAGKSVLLAFMALQFRRYPGARIFVFDKGNSARAAILGLGGQHHVLGIGGPLCFQPLQDIDQPAERSWAAEWLAGLLTHEHVAVTPELKETLWSALGNLASAPRTQRTLTGLSALLQSNTLKSALHPYTLEGPLGSLLDANEERLSFSAAQCFEMEALMNEGGAVVPVLTFLFHRLEAQFDGSPALLILDEAWLFLDNPLFAGRIRDWLKTLRKKNVSVIFATQSLADIADSTIAPAIIESCLQRIFLPNERAIEPQSRAAYLKFGLNDRQVELIAHAQPKREYYLQSARGNRLFELALGPVALAFCGASQPSDQALIDQTLKEVGASQLAESWLRAKDLLWAAEAVADHHQHLLQEVAS